MNALIFAAIVAQVLIYRKQRDIMRHQWKSMQGQLDAMKSQSTAIQTQAQAALDAVVTGKDQLGAMQKQAKLMDRSLVLGTRAYVGVHSIAFERRKARILLQIENIGRVPAKDIEVVIDLLIRMREIFMPIPKPDGPRSGWEYKKGIRGESHWELQIPWLHSYGKTKLFPGSLRIGIVIPLGIENIYISTQQYAEIGGGNADLFVRGVITYSDGFHKGKRTEFSFQFLPRQNLWVSIPETIFDLYRTGPEQPDSDYEPN